MFYVGLLVPYRIGFGVTLASWGVGFWIDALVDLYFLIDIFINLCTAYWDDTGTLVYEKRKIRGAYFR